jgi:glutamate--cysteine ligase
MVESQEDPDMSDTSSSTSGSDCTETRTALTEAEVEALVKGICFKTGPPRTVGVEVEWIVHELRGPRLPVTPERLAAAYEALRTVPLSSALTVEPGGQLELSSLPAASLMECVTTVSADLDAVRAVLREAGLVLAGLGTDPWHPPRRFLHEPRYDAMEACLDRTGPAGRAMMARPARWDTGGAGGWRTRWAPSWSPPSPTRRCWPVLLRAGAPPGNCCGRRSARAARAHPPWRGNRAPPGPGMSWTPR